MAGIKHASVLVVGGAGFIGSHTADALLEQGARVGVLDNLSTGKREYVPRRAKFFRLDMNAPETEKAFKVMKPDFVCAFAANPRVQLTAKDPRTDARTISGLVNILEKCLAFGVKRVVFSSSGFLYGNAKKIPTLETAPAQMLAPYNISKFASEEYLSFFRNERGLDSVVLRYATVFGPRQGNSAMSYYLSAVSNAKPIELYGKKSRDYIYISDAVRANIKALGMPPAADPVFNISTGREVPIPDLCRAIARLMKKPEPKFIRRPALPGEVDRFVLSPKKAERVFGFRPRVGLDAGLRETIAWFRGHRLLA